MKQSAFAALAGVSRQQVSKYATAGKLVLDASGGVDAAASLAALEGHLDETKRQRAILALGAQLANGPPAPGVGLPFPAGAADAAPRMPPAHSTKIEKDQLDIAVRKLDLAERAGKLVSVAEVDAAAREAVALMREAFNNTRREAADRLCAQFGLAADKAPAISRFLAAEFEAALGRFADAAGALAAGGNASAARIDEE